MNRRAILYARVSTDEQAEKGYSIPSQYDSMREYAKTNKFQVIAEFEDDESGKTLARKGLEEARALIHRKETDALIVHSSDRLTRKLAHTLILRDELASTGVELHYVRRGKSEDTPEGRMMDNIEGVFNEYWREKIIEASRRGSIRKAKSGKVVGGGRAPYGYRYHDGTFVVQEDEAHIVRRIYDLYVYGEDRELPLGTYAIAHRLSREGVPTPGETRFAARKRANGIWDIRTVCNILKSETYFGTWRYGKGIGYRGNGGTRSRDDTITVAVPPIVTRSQWDAAQQQRAFNRQMAKRNVKREYLLRGYLHCRCGQRMAGTFSAGKRYYRCNSHVQRFADVEKICQELMIRADKIESQVWQYILDLWSDEAQFERQLRMAMEREQNAIGGKQKQIDIVTKLIAECEDEVNQIARALVKAKGAVGVALEQQMNNANKRHEALSAEKVVLEDEFSKAALTQTDVVAALKYRRDVMEGMRVATYDDKRETLRRLRIEVFVTNHEPAITSRLPLGSQDSAEGVSIESTTASPHPKA